ncbi:MAG: hypothetical protein ACI4J0_01080 [Huintestinicola sp.]|uniref:hypothetical protein n=1 Tax=Huintestinicola sp. TaxID=2981661 RepID=UPI003F0C93FF
MKKLLSVLLAAAAAFTMSTAVYAEPQKTDNPGETTITFDTEKSLEYIHSFGNAADAGLTMELTDKGALSGKALKLSESFKGSLSNRYGGFYLDAADFGLENFGGYTFNIYINVSDKAAKATGQFEIFSDGAGWQSANFLTNSAGSYRVASISIPADSENTKVGVSFPIIQDFDGELGMFDDITIVDNYGKTIANVGDIDNSLYQGPSGFVSVITTILFILVILAVIGGVAYFIVKTMRKYR